MIVCLVGIIPTDYFVSGIGPYGNGLVSVQFAIHISLTVGIFDSACADNLSNNFWLSELFTTKSMPVLSR